MNQDEVKKILEDEYDVPQAPIILQSITVKGNRVEIDYIPFAPKPSEGRLITDLEYQKAINQYMANNGFVSIADLSESQLMEILKKAQRDLTHAIDEAECQKRLQEQVFELGQVAKEACQESIQEARVEERKRIFAELENVWTIKTHDRELPKIEIDYGTWQSLKERRV